jgi:hypothetical protein
MGIGDSFGSAFAKAEIAAGTVLPLAGTAFISVRPEDRDGATAAARRLAGLGFRLLATRGTAADLAAAGIPVEAVNKVSEGSPHVVDALLNGAIALVINTPLGSLDDRCAREACSVEVRRQRNHQHGLKCPGQRITLPYDDGTPTHLLARPVWPEIGPPDFASFQRRSSRSRAEAQSASPSSASFWSSLLLRFNKRSRSQRAGSGRWTTTMPTRAPGRSGPSLTPASAG